MNCVAVLKLALKPAIVAALTAATLYPAAAQAPTLQMLDNLQRGQWELRFRDGEPVRKICLRTGKELIQLQHTGRDCNRIVVEDAAQQVTIQYTCRGDGYGRTNIRRETNSLVQIQAQGIAGGKAFEFAAEARRIAAC